MSGTGGGPPMTRALLGCGKATSGTACPVDHVLWDCPDDAQPVGPFTSPVGNHPSVGCEATPRPGEWCCIATCILDTRLTPASVCPTNERPFQCNYSPDGVYSCIGTL
jgi:hypothetical protein